MPDEYFARRDASRIVYLAAESDDDKKAWMGLIMQADRTRAMSDAGEQSVRIIKSLKVDVVEGRDLPYSDVIRRSSDPFCYVSLGNIRVARTVTKLSALAPFWGESFLFECVSPLFFARLDRRSSQRGSTQSAQRHQFDHPKCIGGRVQPESPAPRQGQRPGARCALSPPSYRLHRSRAWATADERLPQARYSFRLISFPTTAKRRSGTISRRRRPRPSMAASSSQPWSSARSASS